MVNWKNKEEVREYKRNYMRQYSKIPKVKQKVKEYHKEYYQRPEVKSIVKIYKQEYAKIPRVKNKYLQYYATYRQKEGYTEKRKSAYLRDREKVLNKQKEYNRLPHIISRRKEYIKQWSYSENKKCPECGALINNQANRCKPCSAKKGGIANTGRIASEDTRIKLSTSHKEYYLEHPESIELIKERRKTQVFPIKDTKIEVKIQMFLKEIGYEFFTHQYMKDIEHGYQCDILIPALNPSIKLSHRM